jgi:hypothetical protein
LVVGDFNLAPRPFDGLTDGNPSRFTTATERAALNRLLVRANLADLGERMSTPLKRLQIYAVAPIAVKSVVVV